MKGLILAGGSGTHLYRDQGDTILNYCVSRICTASIKFNAAPRVISGILVSSILSRKINNNKIL
jgi:hypothetical protein